MEAADFRYHLPDASIAQEAIEPRDSARLLVAAILEDRLFADLPDLLGGDDLLVVNRTRVRPARLMAKKTETGGTVELLLTKRLSAERWQALVRPARRIRPGTQLESGALRGIVVEGPERGVVVVDLTWSGGDVEDLLPSIGRVPLPPYFRGSIADPDRYQTMFAKTIGSAAAPTAALHFTPALVDTIAAKGIDIAEIDLEVGLDTFRPMDDGPIDEYTMHRERYDVPAATAAAIDAARRRGGRVVAVGTTVVRTLETAAAGGSLVAGAGESDLFIKPGSEFREVDALITNVHAPGTTLLVMIAAILGPQWRLVYEHALASGYRFLSFGDAMFIEVER
jgi:S-adenosylmethionine:tRNA ribosyltransferase-isomerase